MHFQRAVDVSNNEDASARFTNFEITIYKKEIAVSVRCQPHAKTDASLNPS
jgi:hypothetical protein